MSLKDSPQYYHEVLKRIPPRAEPPFEDDAMQARVWGRRWGVHDPGEVVRVIEPIRHLQSDPASKARRKGVLDHCARGVGAIAEVPEIGADPKIVG